MMRCVLLIAVWCVLVCRSEANAEIGQHHHRALQGVCLSPCLWLPSTTWFMFSFTLLIVLEMECFYWFWVTYRVGKLLNKYTSGKIPKAFKHVPSLQYWEEVLYLTEPEKWSPNAMYQATRIFASNMGVKKVERFYKYVLLPRVREDIRKNKRLHFALYQSLKKALYKPAAFNKGIIFTLCEVSFWYIEDLLLWKPSSLVISIFPVMCITQEIVSYERLIVNSRVTHYTHGLTVLLDWHSGLHCEITSIFQMGSMFNASPTGDFCRLPDWPIVAITLILKYTD